MKYLKKFNESESKEFDLEFAMSKIKEEWEEDRVTTMFDEEVLNWVDPDWEDDYESEYDWYIDHNNDEAQDVVIGQMIDWYTEKFGEISPDQSSDLFYEIKSEYNL